jgi:hypothetical protein
MADFLAKRFVEGDALACPRPGQASVGAVVVMSAKIPDI